MRRFRRVLLAACGTLAVALGVAGIFLPVLPTTPFLLLAALCFARSSRRFYVWLTTNRWCGAYIANYREGRGITRRHKGFTLLLLWISIGYAAGFVVSPGWAKLLLLGVAFAVTIHVLRIRTFTPASLRAGRTGATPAPDGGATLPETTGGREVVA